MIFKNIFKNIYIFNIHHFDFVLLYVSYQSTDQKFYKILDFILNILDRTYFTN